MPGTCGRCGGTWGEDATCVGCTFPDGTPRPDPEPVLMAYEDALSMAIFAINTLMHPDASDPVDIDRLEAQSDDVLATLVDIRQTLKETSRA
jgi:hypothetical protein